MQFFIGVIISEYTLKKCKQYIQTSQSGVSLLLRVEIYILGFNNYYLLI
jgi:hypothetical protein